MSNNDHSNPSLEESNDSNSIDQSNSDDHISLNNLKITTEEKNDSNILEEINPTINASRKWQTVINKGLVIKKVLKPGIPCKRAQKGDLCTIQLEGKTKDGTLVEEGSSKVRYLCGEVIEGVDLALGHMTIGEEAELELDPSLGYGALGLKPLVSPGELLVYRVTLDNIEQDAPLQELSVEERLSEGTKLKERGNWWYLRNEFSGAENCYTKALEYLSEDYLPESHGDEIVQKLLMERTNTYNNLAGALIKQNKLDSALKAVEAVLKAQPDNVKALFRKSKILKEKGNLIESLRTVKKAMSHETASETLAREHTLLLETQRKVSLRQRELFRELTRTRTENNEE